MQTDYIMPRPQGNPWGLPCLLGAWTLTRWFITGQVLGGRPNPISDPEATAPAGPDLGYPTCSMPALGYAVPYPGAIHMGTPPAQVVLQGSSLHIP